ncbi:oxidoreductase [Microvirga brassicacearum]|uniref:Oxidoreductase n=1 Tax=Microvirga brassicacearum TaxID=2580413 RepID=A0A5N3P7U3_9HYPH|nr:oxidoreductase [Microvirga brassicacearum]
MTHNFIGVLFVIAGLVANTASAESLKTPTEKPILTISGKIALKNEGDSAQFDRAMLESLGMVTVETSSPWYKGLVKFEGISLDKLMSYVGATGDRVTVIALNDYSTEIPIKDFSDHNTIIALKRDGEYMSVREKGPLFIIYPFDSKPELKSQTYYGRSAWQVAKIIVK